MDQAPGERRERRETVAREQESEGAREIDRYDATKKERKPARDFEAVSSNKEALSARYD